MIQFVLVFIGLVLSVYASWVVLHLRVKSYVPVCDFSSSMSCSKAFSSSSGKLLGVSNAFVGVLYYVFLFVLLIFSFPIFFFTAIALLLSLYLSIVLYQERNACVICILIYVVNVLLFVFSL